MNDINLLFNDQAYQQNKAYLGTNVVLFCPSAVPCYTFLVDGIF